MAVPIPPKIRQSRFAGLTAALRRWFPTAPGRPTYHMPANQSDSEISRSLALACAEGIGWLIDDVIEGRTLAVTGWVLVTRGAPEEVRFLVNGVEFDVVHFPLESPDIERHYYGILNSARARFACYVDTSKVPPDRYFRFECVQGGDPVWARHRAWWAPAAERAMDAPSGARMERVVGSSDAFAFQIGGATLFHRIQDYLVERHSKRYEDLAAIFDWGCGAGRLLAHFADVKGPAIWGGDVDPDNLRDCARRLPFARCEVLPLQPPTTVPSRTFDLVIGISVCTHLSLDNQHRWLAELRRLARPEGLVMLSVQGLAQSGMYRETPTLLREVERAGFLIKGINPEINTIIDADDYYLDVVQTREHILDHWGRHFEIIEFLDGMAANQDMVVMRAP